MGQTTIEWEQGLDEHNWEARIGNVYRLRVFPGISALGVIHYRAQVCNVSLDQLAAELPLPDVATAKRRAIFLAWDHNNTVADVLLANV